MSDQNNDKRVRILVNARVLQQILKEHPETEIELVKGATEQVAEAFRRKVSIDGIANTVIAEINDKLRYRYHFPPEVMAQIKEAAVAALGEKTVEQAKKAAQDQTLKNLDHWWQHNEKTLEARVERLVSEKVQAALNAAAGFGKRASR